MRLGSLCEYIQYERRPVYYFETQHFLQISRLYGRKLVVEYSRICVQSRSFQRKLVGFALAYIIRSVSYSCLHVAADDLRACRFRKLGQLVHAVFCRVQPDEHRLFSPCARVRHSNQLADPLCRTKYLRHQGCIGQSFRVERTCYRALGQLLSHKAHRHARGASVAHANRGHSVQPGAEQRAYIHARQHRIAAGVSVNTAHAG